jgi:hypothetical protein
MPLNELLILYCEQQEATGYSIQTDHSRSGGEFMVSRITISIHYTGNFEQKRKPEFRTFYHEAEAILELLSLTNLNKAIA